jgi:hypothetical protein
MNYLKGWPFTPLDGLPDTPCGGGESSGGSPG